MPSFDVVSEIDAGGVSLLQSLLDEMGNSLPPLILATALPATDIRRIEREVLSKVSSRCGILRKPFDIRDFITMIHSLMGMPAYVGARH